MGPVSHLIRKTSWVSTACSNSNSSPTGLQFNIFRAHDCIGPCWINHSLSFLDRSRCLRTWETLRGCAFTLLCFACTSYIAFGFRTFQNRLDSESFPAWYRGTVSDDDKVIFAKSWFAILRVVVLENAILERTVVFVMSKVLFALLDALVITGHCKSQFVNDRDGTNLSSQFMYNPARYCNCDGFVHESCLCNYAMKWHRWHFLPTGIMNAQFQELVR